MNPQVAHQAFLIGFPLYNRTCARWLDLKFWETGVSTLCARAWCPYRSWMALSCILFGYCGQMVACSATALAVSWNVFWIGAHLENHFLENELLMEISGQKQILHMMMICDPWKFNPIWQILFLVLSVQVGDVAIRLKIWGKKFKKI